MAISTPYDERLARLSAELDGTRLFYGDAGDREKQARKQRTAFLRKQVEESGGAEGSLDPGIYRAVREQAAGVGLRYDADGPAY